MENKDAPEEESVLITAAKSLGKVASKIASVVSSAKPTPNNQATEDDGKATQGDRAQRDPHPVQSRQPGHQASQRAAKKKGTKPVKMNKARLPRKEKKALKQAAESKR